MLCEIIAENLFFHNCVWYLAEVVASLQSFWDDEYCSQRKVQAAGTLEP